MKIDAPRAAAALCSDGLIVDAVVGARPIGDDIAVRIVRESDWRKIMAVVKAADHCLDASGGCKFGVSFLHEQMDETIHALRKHLAKRKADAAKDHSSEVQP